MFCFNRSLPWTRRVGFASGCVVFLTLGGCRSGSKDFVAIPQDTTHVVQVAALPTPRLYGPRSKESIEECYALPKQVTFGPGQRLDTKSAPAATSTSAAIVPGAGWDVKLTQSWKHIVIHHSASERGNAEIFHREHKAREWDGLGYHFVIGNGNGSGDGQVEAGYRWTRQERGAHAGNIEYNEQGIGICLVGNFENGTPSAKQMESLRKLVRFLQGKCGIASARVIGHQHVPGKETKCPGRHFDVSAFRMSLNETSAAVRPVPMNLKHTSHAP